MACELRSREVIQDLAGEYLRAVRPSPRDSDFPESGGEDAIPSRVLETGPGGLD